VAGKTVDEATEHALDKLGVAAADAEVVVLNEPKIGLFGRLKEEARVQARVRPVGARPKRERSRDRGRRSGQGGERSTRGSKASSGRRSSQGQSSQGQTRLGDAGAESTNGAAAGVSQSTGASRSAASSGAASPDQAAGGSGSSSAAPGAGRSRSARRRRSRSRASSVAAQNGSSGESEGREVAGSIPDGSGSATRGEVGDRSGERSTMVPTGPTGPKETTEMAEGMTLEEQGEVGRQFLSGLMSEYGIEASLETRVIDDETVEIAAIGDDLGVLVGPRGSTLAALQDLTRAVVQRQCPSRTDRILVDVAGYREKRSAALQRFSAQIAEEVLESGQERALEPMSPADRKAVHDAVNEIDGVVTRSEGEDPHRHIVIAPEG
jgi:spoIIIJ-associated protein